MAIFWVFMLLVPASLWCLGSRAIITQGLWSRYPQKLWILPFDFRHFMDCAACTGFWWGVVVFLVLCAGNLSPYTWYTAPGWGLCSIVTTARVAYYLDHALYQLGSAAGGGDDPPSTQV